jgi:hypothetical protein
MMKRMVVVVFDDKTAIVPAAVLDVEGDLVTAVDDDERSSKGYCQSGREWGRIWYLIYPDPSKTEKENIEGKNKEGNELEACPFFRERPRKSRDRLFTVLRVGILCRISASFWLFLRNSF